MVVSFETTLTQTVMVMVIVYVTSTAIASAEMAVPITTETELWSNIKILQSSKDAPYPKNNGLVLVIQNDITLTGPGKVLHFLFRTFTCRYIST